MAKIQYGLKNVYRAPVIDTNGVITYGTPVPMLGVVSLSLKGLIDSLDVAADDNPQYAVIIDNKGYDGDIEFQIFNDQDKVDCLGATLDSNNCIVENKDDKPKPQALMFEIATDVKARRRVLYNCLFTKPDITSITKGDKVTPQTDKLTIKVRPATDTGDIKYKTSDTTSIVIYDAWYNNVIVRDTTPGTQITPDDIIFDKKTANQQDAVINLIPAGAETLVSITNGITALTLTTHYTVVGNVVTIKKVYLATLAVGNTDLVFAFSAGASKTLDVTVIDTTSA